MNKLFVESINKEIRTRKSHICVGLDSDYEKLPAIVKRNNSLEKSIFVFNKEIVDTTQDVVVAYKPNLVFYSGYGLEGLKALIKTNEYIKQNYPRIKLIAECKRTEIGRSAELASRELFNTFHFDALNIMPWYGEDSAIYYQNLKNKAVFVICHDTNPSAIDIQDKKIEKNKYVYEYVAEIVTKKWNKTGNILIETALTYPQALRKIKKISDAKQFFLIVGLGAQGGNIEELRIFDKERNFIVSASRSIIFSSLNSNFAEAARKKALSYSKKLNFY